MIGPDELRTVRFPDLKENQVIIPKTTNSTCNISLLGTDANKTFVKNLGRNIIRKLVVNLEGDEIINTDDCDTKTLPTINEEDSNDMREKRDRLVECVLSGNSKQYLGKEYTEQQIIETDSNTSIYYQIDMNSF